MDRFLPSFPVCCTLSCRQGQDASVWIRHTSCCIRRGDNIPQHCARHVDKLRGRTNSRGARGKLLPRKDSIPERCPQGMDQKGTTRRSPITQPILSIRGWLSITGNALGRLPGTSPRQRRQVCLGDCRCTRGRRRVSVDITQGQTDRQSMIVRWRR